MTALPQIDSAYRLLVQGISDYAIYMLTLQGNVDSWNAGAERFKGYTSEEIVGKHFSCFYTQEDRAAGAPEQALRTALEHGRFEIEANRLRKDGSTFLAHVVIDLIRDDNGQPIGFAKITRDMTEQRQQQQKAMEQERNFRLLVEGVNDYAIYMLAPDGTVSNWNAGAERFKGYVAGEIVGKHFSTFYSMDDRRKGLPYRALATALAKGKFEGEGWRIRKDGSRFWAHVIIDALHDDKGKLLGFAKITRDLSEQKRQTDAARTMKENLDLALANMSQGLCFFNDDEELVLCNSRFCELLGVQDSGIKAGSTFTDLLWAIRAGKEADPEATAQEVEHERGQHHMRIKKSRGAFSYEQTIAGHVLAVDHRKVPTGGWIIALDDITERKGVESKIVHLAHHDVLTGLSNRSLFRQSVQEHFTSRRACTVLYMDLDRFKPVNDSLGHPVGDEVLQMVASRAEKTLRKGDLASRLGGDEFAILLSGSDDAAEATAVADRLIREISRPFNCHGIDINVGASVGVAIAYVHGEDPDLLFRNADLALYAAKQAGRGCSRLYEPGMEKQIEGRLSLERDIRYALATGQFALHYQAIVSVETDAVQSFEALLRWESPTRGKVSPADFIPFAEEIGLMAEIGDWVLKTACREAATWSDDIGISINVSPAQFVQAGFVNSVRQVLQDTGLSGERLELEITETTMIGDMKRAKDILTELRALGVRIALDDFGTGYSSLSFLRNLPFTRIKIDKSFIEDLENNSESLAIIRAVTSLCEGLGVSSTAEGVETVEQMAILRTEGCSDVQGFLINRPSAAADSQVWLEKSRQNRRAAKPTLVAA